MQKDCKLSFAFSISLTLTETALSNRDGMLNFISFLYVTLEVKELLAKYNVNINKSTN